MTYNDTPAIWTEVSNTSHQVSDLMPWWGELSTGDVVDEPGAESDSGGGV
ncbi:hypothetical protein LCGC14_0397220 [marine sediment metagenome]|uniref:Uncharacterized protein n=1 Tax=marine sediment metagenome TaxID=412755 RepID=A0A0F9T3K5_9ZZZZ